MTRIYGTAAPAIETRDAPEHLSFTQLQMLHPRYRYSCPRKWAYKYRISLPDERSASLAVGSAMDVALNDYFQRRLQGADRVQAFAEAAPGGIKSLQSEPVEAFLPHTCDDYESVLMSAFAAFTEYEGNCEPALIQDKHRFTVRVADDHVIPILGYSDRIDADGTIVDHKFSGSPRWSQDGEWHEDYLADKRDQLLLYWLARRAEEDRNGPLSPPLTGKARLVVAYHKIGLLKPQVRSIELTLDREQGRDVLVRVVEAARVLQENRLAARPGEACRYCSFLGRCRDDEAARGRPWMEVVGVPF